MPMTNQQSPGGKPLAVFFVAGAVTLFPAALQESKICQTGRICHA
jgi:hypothetical protein